MTQTLRGWLTGVGSGNLVRKGRKPPPISELPMPMRAWWTCVLRRLEDKSTSRVRPRKKRNLSRNRWPTAQLWLQNTKEIIKNSSSARGICHKHQASRAAIGKHSRPTFHTDPSETQSGQRGRGQQMEQEQWLKELFSSSLARKGRGFAQALFPTPL